MLTTLFASAVMLLVAMVGVLVILACVHLVVLIVQWGSYLVGRISTEKKSS